MIQKFVVDASGRVIDTLVDDKNEGRVLPNSIKLNDSVTFRVRITNNRLKRNDFARNIWVTDTLPRGFNFVDPLTMELDYGVDKDVDDHIMHFQAADTLYGGSFVEFSYLAKAVKGGVYRNYVYVDSVKNENGVDSIDMMNNRSAYTTVTVTSNKDIAIVAKEIVKITDNKGNDKPVRKPWPTK